MAELPPGSTRNALTNELPEPLLHFDASPFAARLAEVDSLRTRYQDALRANLILPNTLETLRVELTYHSNAIEGSTLSLRDTQLVIEGREPNSGKSLREIYEARNHDRALRKIEAWASAGSQPLPLTEKNVLDIHAEVMADIDPKGAGLFRTNRVLITGTRFIPPGNHKFAELIPTLISLANQPHPHPIIQAAEFHYNIVAVHPFNDGNGRTARLMMNYHLLRHGYPLAIVPIDKRSDYLAALDEANTGRSQPLSTLLIQCVEDSIYRLIGEADA